MGEKKIVLLKNCFQEVALVHCKGFGEPKKTFNNVWCSFYESSR